MTVARVIKTHGRNGEVVVESHSDALDRIVPGMRVFAPSAQSTRRELKIEEVWPHQGRLVVKFEGVDTISDAEALAGCELQVPAAERAQLQPGWTYISDLVGCTLLDGERELGRIEDVRFGAGEAPLLIVGATQKATAQKGTARKIEYEIPFAEAYMQGIDLQHKQVRMQLPEGMLEVNAPLTEEEKREQQKKK